MKKDSTKAIAAKRKSAKRATQDTPRITKKMLARAVAMPPITDPRWKNAMKRLQQGGVGSEEPVVHVDKEVISWFKQQDKNYETSINRVLLHYVLSHQPNA